jgi:hypothetical protein
VKSHPDSNCQFLCLTQIRDLFFRGDDLPGPTDPYEGSTVQGDSNRKPPGFAVQGGGICINSRGYEIRGDLSPHQPSFELPGELEKVLCGSVACLLYRLAARPSPESQFSGKGCQFMEPFKEPADAELGRG